MEQGPETNKWQSPGQNYYLPLTYFLFTTYISCQKSHSKYSMESTF